MNHGPQRPSGSKALKRHNRIAWHKWVQRLDLARIQARVGRKHAGAGSIFANLFN